MKTIRTIVTACLAVVGFGSSVVGQRYTPSSYEITVYGVELSTDGNEWGQAMRSESGKVVDLADAASLGGVLGDAAAITVGTYRLLRMTISNTLVWSHPAAPISLQNQAVTVNGPPGPAPGQMTVYFATHDLGGRPGGDSGGEGTAAKPLLLGAPAEVVAGSATVLRLVFVVSDTLMLNGSDYDLAPPSMFFVAENDLASKVSGTFNTVLYNTVKRLGATTYDEWSYTSGHGVLSFDGAGAWTWTGTTNQFDLLTKSGAKHASVVRQGRYGVNGNGSFWMTAKGEPGTLQGAISQDGTMLFASMYDSPSSHMMFFGVQSTLSASVLNVAADFYFTTHDSRFDNGSNQLRYSGSFGVVTGDGTGSISGSQDSNDLRVTNPTSSNPTVGAPQATLGGAISSTLSVASDGTTTNTTGELAGAFLQSGLAACLAWDFSGTYAPSHEFGFLVRQSPAGTFDLASLNGTYFGGHFGDEYSPANGGKSSYFSGFFKVTFDGNGSANVTVVENSDGDISIDTFNESYVVDSTTGTVSFIDSAGVQSAMKGAIGPGAMSFILTVEPKVNNVVSERRFLGLGLKQ